MERYRSLTRRSKTIFPFELKSDEKTYIVNQNSLNKAKFDVQTCLLLKPDRGLFYKYY